MAAILRLQDLTPSLTPPPSDRGECDDTTMLNTEAYLPEVFYPSPAPSFSHHRSAFSPHSPDLTLSDSVYDTDEDQRRLLFESPASQMYPAPTATQNIDIYPTEMSYPSYGSNAWLQYSSYPAPAPMYTYTTTEQAPAFRSYVAQAPTNVIPPTPEGVSGGSFNFNDPMKQETSFLPSYASAHAQAHSPAARSASLSGMSSRSDSPGASGQMTSEAASSRSARLSIMSQRSSSSSLHAYGVPIRTPNSSTVQAWRCAYPNCTSRAVFTRGCDLRKHYNRHSKHLFCRVEGCPQSEAACIATAQQQALQTGGEAHDPSKLVVTGGFSSKKDRARHEAKHNPGIKCEWRGPNGEECGRLFSRMDNMKDHVRRIHNKGQPQPSIHSKAKAR